MTWFYWLKSSGREQKDAELVDRAIRCIKKNRTDKALSLLLPVVSRAPKNYSNSFEKDGNLYIKFWDMEDFISYAGWHEDKGHREKVNWIGNAYPRAFYQLAYMAFENGQYEKAIGFLDKGLNLEPNNAKIMIEKAQALVKLGRYSEALTILDDVVSQNGYINPLDKARALRSKGFILVEEGDVNLAERSFQESFQYEPNNDIAKHELQIINTIRSCIEEAARVGISEDEFNLWYHMELKTGLFMSNKSQFNGSEERDSISLNFQEAIFERMFQFVHYFRYFSDDRSQLGKSEEELEDLYFRRYMSYYMVLSNSNMQSHWNAEIDQIARGTRALSEKEIEDAQTDLNQAILNRIKLRLVMDASENKDHK